MQAKQLVCFKLSLRRLHLSQSSLQCILLVGLGVGLQCLQTIDPGSVLLRNHIVVLRVDRHQFHLVAFFADQLVLGTAGKAGDFRVLALGVTGDRRLLVALCVLVGAAAGGCSGVCRTSAARDRWDVGFRAGAE